jgi:uncharacterized damage-inducible protein DinB
LDGAARRAYHPSVADDLRYPVGKYEFRPDAAVSAAERAVLIGQIADAPARLAAEVAGLSDAQLDTPYRPGGWTVRQVVHHVPDSHLNAYVRCKLIVTEDQPKLKTYEEAAWAELVDGRGGPVDVSLMLLKTLHQRWIAFLRSLDERAFARTGVHPQYGAMRVDDILQLYAWHGRHHVAHIHGLRERSRW